jgi:hypothetical protein
MTMTVIDFLNASQRNGIPRRRAAYRSRPGACNGPNMRTCLFRSYDVILKSDEADLVRDVCLDLDKAEKKLKALRQRLQGVQEQAAALTTAEIKLTAAIVAALLSTRGNDETPPSIA